MSYSCGVGESEHECRCCTSYINQPTRNLSFIVVGFFATFSPDGHLCDEKHAKSEINCRLPLNDTPSSASIIFMLHSLSGYMLLKRCRSANHNCVDWHSRFA